MGGGKIENRNHFSPAEAETRTELGKISNEYDVFDKKSTLKINFVPALKIIHKR